jgi:hypothetical protein
MAFKAIMFNVFGESNIRHFAMLITPIINGNYSLASIGYEFMNLSANFDSIYQDSCLKKYRGKDEDIDALVYKLDNLFDSFYEGNFEDFLEFLLLIATGNRTATSILLHKHFVRSGLEVWSNHSLEYIVLITKFFDYLMFGDWLLGDDAAVVDDSCHLKPVSLEAHIGRAKHPFGKGGATKWSSWVQDLLDTTSIGLNQIVEYRHGFTPTPNMASSISLDMLDQLNIKSRIVLAALILLASNEN